MKTLISFVVLTLFFAPQNLKADDADEPLIETQQLLKNKTEREKSLADNPKGTQADQFVKQLTGGDEKLTEEIYALAADVFANVVKDCNHDVSKMKDAIERFSKDPSKFTEMWTEKQKQQLQNLSEKLPTPILQK